MKKYLLSALYLLVFQSCQTTYQASFDPKNKSLRSPASVCKDAPPELNLRLSQVLSRKASPHQIKLIETVERCVSGHYNLHFKEGENPRGTLTQAEKLIKPSYDWNMLYDQAYDCNDDTEFEFKAHQGEQSRENLKLSLQYIIQAFDQVKSIACFNEPGV